MCPIDLIVLPVIVGVVGGIDRSIAVFARCMPHLDCRRFCGGDDWDVIGENFGPARDVLRRHRLRLMRVTAKEIGSGFFQHLQSNALDELRSNGLTLQRHLLAPLQELVILRSEATKNPRFRLRRAQDSSLPLVAQNDKTGEFSLRC